MADRRKHNQLMGPMEEASGSGEARAGVIATITSKIPRVKNAQSRLPEAEKAESSRGNSSKRSSNFLTYAQTALDSFARRPVCELDSLVFSWLSYFRLSSSLRAARTPEGIALHELLRAEDFGPMFGTSWDPQGSRDLLFAVCASPRFRDVRLCRFAYKTDRATSEQFAAMTFLLPDGSVYVAYRGTDSTLIGWREDFNMASQCPVPSQREALHYLEFVMRDMDRPVYVGGHSKGGNLAVYAAAMVPQELQGRVIRVFSHDGPGFDSAFLASEGFSRVRDRVRKTVPKSSIIGLIMDEERDFCVVESSGVSILQHNPFLWETDGCGFVLADGLSASSRYFGSTLSAWMDRFTPEERGAFIATLFQVFAVTGATRFADIRDTWRTSLPAMCDAAESLAPEQREFVVDVLKALARVATIEKVSDRASNLIGALRSNSEGAEG